VTGTAERTKGRGEGRRGGLADAPTRPQGEGCVCDVCSLRFSSRVCRSLPCPCPFLCPPRPVTESSRGAGASQVEAAADKRNGKAQTQTDDRHRAAVAAAARQALTQRLGVRSLRRQGRGSALETSSNTSRPWHESGQETIGRTRERAVKQGAGPCSCRREAGGECRVAGEAAQHVARRSPPMKAEPDDGVGTPGREAES
jgi:hypothetical protein